MSPASSLAGPSNLISRNEKILVEARKNYYEQVSKEKKNEQKVKFGHYLGNNGMDGIKN